ncbi:Rieske (2Fe-2S) protein [Agaribacterium haliotis]|uniref:Rieske (2Fe-2S) protein n=1 Tax=Agaribacterium haliotis TaxID=2013869 RepID=UPI000BB5977F|nr:Rieske (2Fe-2S) protein [Agaribacterium haliotis]
MSKPSSTEQHFLCPLQELAQQQSRAFEIDGQALFIVREGERWFAYRNRCPHQGIKLDWDNEQFLDYDGELIQCATHGALFRLDTGHCVAGPCAGSKLEALKLLEQQGQLFVELN